VFALMRLNREYRAEAAILERFRTNRPDNFGQYASHYVFVLVNSVDLAVIEALRYGRGLRADELTAVHFMVDEDVAHRIEKRWQHYGLVTPLRIIDCADRRLVRAAHDLVCATSDKHPDANVTLLLPRRSYAPLLGRLLHDRTADRVARAVSRMPHAAATIVPYDVQSQIREAFPDMIEERVTRELEKVQARVAKSDQQQMQEYEHPAAHLEAPPAVIAIDGLVVGQRTSVEGRVTQIDQKTRDGKPLRLVTIGDDSGELTVAFGHGGDDIEPGQVIRLVGKARQNGNRPVFMADPGYSIIAQE
jgi:hypothetical protein